MEKGKGTQTLSREVQTGLPCLPDLCCGLGAAGSDLDNSLYLREEIQRVRKSFHWVMKYRVDPLAFWIPDEA